MSSPGSILSQLKLYCDHFDSRNKSTENSPGNEGKLLLDSYNELSNTEIAAIIKEKLPQRLSRCHLWLFILCMLTEPKLSHVISWLDQVGIFCIQNPAKFAQIWGILKNRQNIHFDIVSRSLRHYYRKNILKKISKVKYTYKFNFKQMLVTYYKKRNDNKSYQEAYEYLKQQNIRIEKEKLVKLQTDDRQCLIETSKAPNIYTPMSLVNTDSCQDSPLESMGKDGTPYPFSVSYSRSTSYDTSSNNDSCSSPNYHDWKFKYESSIHSGSGNPSSNFDEIMITDAEGDSLLSFGQTSIFNDLMIAELKDEPFKVDDLNYLTEEDALVFLKLKVCQDTQRCQLWMFLLHLLNDPTKTHIIFWIDNEGTFCINKPNVLAELWGQNRIRCNMTYDKLSRSLRHYYEKKILNKVCKKKYTFKFNAKQILKIFYSDCPESRANLLYKRKKSLLENRKTKYCFERQDSQSYFDKPSSSNTQSPNSSISEYSTLELSPPDVKVSIDEINRLKEKIETQQSALGMSNIKKIDPLPSSTSFFDTGMEVASSDCFGAAEMWERLAGGPTNFTPLKNPLNETASSKIKSFPWEEENYVEELLQLLA